MAAVGGQARHAADERTGAGAEARPHRRGIDGTGEALDVHDAGRAMHGAPEPETVTAILDLAAHRHEHVRPPVEPGGRPSRPHRAPVVKRADQDRPTARGRAEPVIMRVVGVHHVDRLGPHEGAQPPHVPAHPPGAKAHLERQPGQGFDAGLARLGLEAVAADQAEENAVTATGEPDEEPDHGIGAARPPAVRHEVQDGELRRAGHRARGAEPRAPMTAS